MRSSTPQLNVEQYRPEQYRPPAGSRHTAAVYSNRRPKNLIAPLGLTFGILAVVGSWIPFLNFLFLALAILGSILSTIGFVQPHKNKLNKGESLLGLMLNAVAIVLFFSSYLIIYFASQQGNPYRIGGAANASAYGWLTGFSQEKRVVGATTAPPLEMQDADAVEDSLGNQAGIEAPARVIEEPFGKIVSVSGLDVVVNGIEEQSTLAAESGSPAYTRAGGKFVVVDVTLKNTAHIPNSFFRSDDFFMLSTCEALTTGCPQYYDYKGSIGAFDDYATGKKLEPQLEVHARLVYEVPQDSRSLWLGVANVKQEAASQDLSGEEAYQDAYFLKLQ